MTNRKTLKEYFNFWNVIIALSLVMIFIFIFYPLFSLLVKSVYVNGEFSFDSFKEFARLPYYYSTLFNSIVVSVLATVFGTLLGLPMAYFIARYNIPFKRFINICVILSLMSPPFIGAYSWVLLLGRNGFITNFFAKLGIHIPSIYGLRGIILVYTLKLFPYVFLYVSGALQNIDSSLEEAAESLGMSSWRRLLTVTLPLVTPTIASGALMVFMTSLADFGTPMLIGEGYRVLPVLVYQEFMSETGGNDSMASALSIIIIVFSTLVLLLQTYVVNRKSYQMSALRPPAVRKLKPVARFFSSLFCYLVVFFAMLPQLTVVITSFKNTNGPVFAPGFGVQSYKDVFYKLRTNVRNTLVFSTVAIILMVLIAMLLSYCIVRKRNAITTTLDVFLMLPYVIPGAVLGITLLAAFNKPPIFISGTAAIMIIAYIIRKMPYTLRSSSSILYQIDPSIDEASISLGVSPLKTFFKVTAAMMLPGVISGAVISWVTTINELSSSIILYTGRTGTISVAIYNEVVRGGFGTAAALATILTLITTATLLIFFKVSGKETISI